MNINTSLLSYFCAVAKNENITQTAKELHIAQPALSRAMYHLEQELGVTLFAREKNIIRLNDNGKLFLKDCQQILGILSDSVAQMKEREQEHIRTLSIQIRSGGVHFAALSYHFRMIHPDVQFVVQSSGSGEQADSLRSEMDMVLCASIYPTVSHEKTLLGKERLYLTMSKDHSLAKKKAVHLSELSDKNWISTDLGNDMSQIQLHFCRAAGFEPNIFVKTEKINILTGLIAMNEGICLLPKLEKSQVETSYLKQIPVDDIDCYRYIHLTITAKRAHLKLAEEFQRFCMEHFDSITQ